MGVPRVGGMTGEGTVEVQMAGAQPGPSGTQIWEVRGAKIWLRGKRTEKRKLSIQRSALWSRLWTVSCLVHSDPQHIAQPVSLLRQEYDVTFLRIFCS